MKLKVFFNIIKIIYEGSPKSFIACICLISLVSLFTPLYLVALNNLIDVITTDFSIENVILPTIFFLLMILITNTKSIINLLGSYLWITAEISLQKAIIQKANKKSLSFYDTPSFYNDLEKANQGYGTALGTAMMFISALFITTLSVITIVAYLVQISGELAFALLLMVGIKIISYIISSKKVQELRDKQVSEVRTNSLLSNYLWHKETRIFGASTHFFNKWSNSNSTLIKEESKVERKNIILIFLFNSFTYFCYCTVLILVIVSLLNGTEGDIGDVVVLFVAMESIFASLDAIVLHFGNVFKNITLSEDFFDFLSADDEEESSRNFTNESALILKDVEFSYPQSNDLILKSINLNVQEGEKIAIVGKNGAGKSTLVKLMMGLYKPTSGSIEYGTSLRLVDGEHSNITAVFQDVNTYCLTLGENIAISDLKSMNDTKCIDDAFVNSFSARSFSRFTDGINTKIGREFGGIDLSGGEKQRLAIGRALFRGNTIAFFDEPSSAIDPLSEDELYKKLLEISEQKTTFFITHRLSSVRFADRIILIDNGEVLEQGTHKELIDMNGQYAFLYNLQKNDYVE